MIPYSVLESQYVSDSYIKIQVLHQPILPTSIPTKYKEYLKKSYLVIQQVKSYQTRYS